MTARHDRSPLPVALLLAGVVVSPALADAGCVDDSKNLLARRSCDFARGIEGWVAADAEATHVSHDTASSESGALAAHGVDGSVVVLSPCVQVKGETEHRASTRVKTTGGEVHFCQVAARQYIDSECADGRETLEVSAGVAPTAEWQTASGSATTAPGAKSVQLHLECNGEPGFGVLFDDVVLAKP